MIWLTSRVAAFGPVDAIVLILAFGAFSAFWLAGSALTLAQKPAWSAVALLGGFLAAFGSNWFLTRFGGNHLLAALLIGYATTMSVTLLAGARIYRGDGTAARKAPVQLPSSGYLFLEAGWPFAYGSLYMVFILIPHALGWLSAARLSQAPMLAVAALEVGLVLSLLPMIILDGVASHALRSFWRRLSQELPATPGTDAAHFDSGLSLFYRTYRERYLWFLSAASLAAALGFHFLMNSGYVFAAYQLPDVGTVAMIFLAGLVAYGLLGWGAFNSMFCITLDRADLPVRAVILGMIVLIAMGVPLTIAHGVGYSVVAFIGGALMFCISSQVMVNRVMASLHHHYLCSQ